MQLSSARTAAALALVGATLAPDARAAGPLDARVSSELAGYADSDHVAVFTPSVSGHVANSSAGWTVDGTYLVDVISAASVDIVSTASPRWTEVRQGGSLAGTYKPKDIGVTVDGSFSDEPDYVAYGLGASVLADFDDRNLTLSAGYGYGHDTIGRAGTPFAIYSHAFDHHTVSLGLTRLLDHRTVLSLAGDLTFEGGDSSKPYRYIPLFASQVAPTIGAGATVQDVSRLRLPESVIERTPLSRQRFGLSARLAHRFRGATARFETTLYDDSWGLAAFSADARHLFDLGPRFSLGPHLRYYVQSEVSFWKVAYVGSESAVPAFRTGDRELGPLMNFTGGGSIQWLLGPVSALDAWVVLASFDATYTRFMDDLYITRRLATLGALTLEAAW